jgi:hypothetical protein
MARGSIRKRGPTWTVVVDVGRDPTTRKRRQTSRGGFKTRKDAARWLTQTLGQVDQGGYVTPTRELTGEYLLEWLAAIRSSLRPSTWESYERPCRRHLIPASATSTSTSSAPATCPPCTPTCTPPGAWTEPTASRPGRCSTCT